MDYEKAYKDSIERATQKWECGDITREDLEYIFSEFVENEDESIRKALIELVKQSRDILYPSNQKSMLAWLEKKGEQNLKFIIGDTIKKKSTGDIVTICEIDLKNREYRLSNTGFIPFKYEYLWELVEQKPVEWREEDMERYESCLKRLGTGNPAQPETFNSKWFREHCRSQPHWKPSEEQMNSLYETIVQTKGYQYSMYLSELYEKLKAL